MALCYRSYQAVWILLVVLVPGFIGQSTTILPSPAVTPLESSPPMFDTISIDSSPSQTPFLPDITLNPSGFATVSQLSSTTAAFDSSPSQTQVSSIVWSTPSASVNQTVIPPKACWACKNTARRKIRSSWCLAAILLGLLMAVYGIF